MVCCSTFDKIQSSCFVLSVVENSYIKFLDNFKMDAFGKGDYKIIDEQNIIANFGDRIHNISFNIDYTEFSSIRKDDLQIINGKQIILTSPNSGGCGGVNI